MCRPDGRHVLNNQGTDDYVLTFKHKIAFVPFETPLKSAISLNCFSELEKKGIGNMANSLASGLTGYYNLLKLLNGEEDFCRLN